MTHNLNLPADFENYPDMRKRGFLRMKELKENGAKVVGVFCSFVPLEIVYAAGMVPVGLCSFTDEPIPAAETHLPKNLCPLIKASYGFDYPRREGVLLEKELDILKMPAIMGSFEML